MFKIDFKKSSTSTTLWPTGQIDALSVLRVKSLFKRWPGILRKCSSAGVSYNVIFDLSRLNLLDSCGLRALLTIFESFLKKKLTLRIKGTCGQPLALVRLFRLDLATGLLPSFQAG